MKIIVKLDEEKFPPLLSFVIYDAPHKRMHAKILQQYREFLRMACWRVGIDTPIDGPVDLSVNFVNPTSPDLDNLLAALYRALDGKALSGPGILTDDGNIQVLKDVRKFFQR